MNDSSAKPPTILTRVALAGRQHQFRGHSVAKELAGKEPFWSIVSLALDGPMLGANECRVLDALCSCVLAADPRFWPLKVTRLASSYGRTMAGFCAGWLIAEGAMVGFWSAGRAATFLERVREEVHTSSGSKSVTDVVHSILEAGGPTPGFGVHFRGEDERVVVLRSQLAEYGRTEQPFWKLLSAIEAVLIDRRQLPIHVDGAIAATLLDLGFRPNQIALLSMVAGSTAQFLANAVEGAEQASPVLQQLPISALEYVGRPPRRPSRAG